MKIFQRLQTYINHVYNIIETTKINRKIDYKLLVIIDLFLILVTLFIKLIIRDINELHVILISSLSLAYLIYSIIIYYFNNKTIITPYIFFYMSLFCFTFGQSTLFLFNIKHNSFQLFYSYFSKLDYLYNPLVFATICLIGFNCGQNIYMFCMDKKTVIKKNINREFIEPGIIANYVKYLMIVLIPLAFTSLFVSLIYSIRFGYPQYIDYIPSLFLSINYYIKPVCIGSLFLGIAVNSHKKNIFFIILLLLAIIDILTGSRTNGLSLILIIIWLKFFIENKINRKKIIYLCSLICIVVLFVPLLSYTRSGENILSLNIIFKKNPIIEIIAEFGYSLFPLCLIMILVPNQYVFQYGRTFLDAMLSIFPDSLINNFYLIQEMPADWITNLYDSNSGFGFNIFAEFYWNFGYIGILLAIILGFIVCQIFYYKDSVQLKENYIKYYNVCMVLYIIFTLPRRSMHEVAFPLFYFVVIPNLLFNYKRIICWFKNKIN